jgi:hypothetical protein
MTAPTYLAVPTARARDFGPPSCESLFEDGLLHNVVDHVVSLYIPRSARARIR